MLITSADIANQALSLIGIDTEISNLDTETSKEAKAVRRFFVPCREEVLRDVAWPFATVIEALQLVATDPNAEWTYSYRYPANAVAVRRIPSGARKESPSTLIPYKIARDATGRLIWCDLEDATVEYTHRETDITRYDPDFVSALAYMIAARIAPRFGTEALKAGMGAAVLYQRAIRKAAASALNEEQSDPQHESEFITARE